MHYLNFELSQQNLNFLTSLLGGLQVLDIFVAIALYFIFQKNDLYKNAVFLWVGLFGMFLSDSYLGEASVNHPVLSFPFVLITGWNISLLIRKLYDIKVKHILFPHYIMITLAIILRFVCPENFALVALPISISATGPIFVALYFVYKKLKEKKLKISIVDKAFILTSTIWGLHFLDYPFLRPIVDLKFSFFGFLFAILLTYLLSILIPVVINKRIYLNINDLIMEQLDVRTKELARAQRIISKQERLATMGNLVAGVAHEIKNPLNIIGVSTSYLQKFIHKYPADDLVEYFKSSNEDKIRQFTRDVSRFVEATETISTSISRADEVVKSMLGYARGDESKELVKTNLNAFIDDNIKLVESSQSLRDSLTIKTDFDIECPPINIYINDIRRILINLLENSIYAISKKTKLENGFRGVITISTKFNSDKEEILISFIDNGVGIPEAIKERVFDPFMTTKPVGEGTGLGLSISQEIVKEHMGRLEVESTEGQGASFHLYISTNL